MNETVEIRWHGRGGQGTVTAAGGRVATATSGPGLALMWKMLFVVSGMRLPIVMPVVNRALSAPLNIHCDHSEAMGARDGDDYDTSDRLCFEPLTEEEVLHVVETEKPMGVIVQFGGQTRLNLALPLHLAGVRFWAHIRRISQGPKTGLFSSLC